MVLGDGGDVDDGGGETPHPVRSAVHASATCTCSVVHISARSCDITYPVVSCDVLMCMYVCVGKHIRRSNGKDDDDDDHANTTSTTAND